MAGFKIVLGALQPLIDRITMSDGRQMPRIWGLEDWDDFDKRERFPWKQLKDEISIDEDMAGFRQGAHDPKLGYSLDYMTLPELRKAIDSKLSLIEFRKDQPAFQDLIMPLLREVEVMKKELAGRSSIAEVE